jgi:hypothetical protein
MPYTVEELKKNEFWQKLHEQDRVDYQKKLEQAETFKNVNKVVNDKGVVLDIQEVTPMRNKQGTFLAFENPDTGLNYDRPDQYISVIKQSPVYHKGDLWNQVLDREIKELM